MDSSRSARAANTHRAGGTHLRAADEIELGDARVSLFGSSNIWVEDSLTDDCASIGLTQTIIQRALEGTAAGQLEIIVFDDALTGLSSPFAPLNTGGEKLLHVFHDAREFKSTLRYLRDHVQAVKNVMRGEAANLVDFRHRIDYPVEGYKLVVVSTDISFLDDETQGQLAILLRAAPVAGVSFLIHSMTLDANPYIISMCEQLALQPHGVITRERGGSIRGWSPPSPHELATTSRRLAETLASHAMTTIPFADIQPTDGQWQHTSENGVTFAVGSYGEDVVHITLGDELNQRHNMLVTGAVGQGKSNLISVIIHSLCQRYSPRELKLYLLDFKEGVTLQAFFDAESGRYLPHARVLGLDADREFGHSVFLHLHQIYRERMKLFKMVGVQDIRGFRRLRPESEMPRIVVVIDEFQMMFADRDRVSDEIAELLVRGVRLFRACGIHVILASQTIGGNVSLMGAAGEGLFAQVPVRVALKNSLAESRASLGDKNDAATHLRSREAIVNLEYGDVSANMKTTIAFADEKGILPYLRESWWQTARGWAEDPYVFQGEPRRSLATDAGRLRDLRASGCLSVLLGSRIEVDARPLEVPFGRDIGRNIAVIGSGDAVPILQSMALSLAAQAPQMRFVVLDLLESEAAWGSSRQTFTQVMKELGADLEIIHRAGVQGFLSELILGLAERDATADLVIVGLSLDRCRPMPLEFQEIVRIGPSVGVHVIGWWLKLESFKDHVGYGGDSHFDTRLALRLDAQSAKQLMNDPLLEWRAAENRILAWDSAELVAPLRVIPYSVVDASLTAALSAGC